MGFTHIFPPLILRLAARGPLLLTIYCSAAFEMQCARFFALLFFTTHFHVRRPPLLLPRFFFSFLFFIHNLLKQQTDADCCGGVHSFGITVIFFKLNGRNDCFFYLSMPRTLIRINFETRAHFDYDKLIRTCIGLK